MSKIGRQAPPRPGKPTATRRTATAAAAYRTGTAITDERTGELHDYTPRQPSVEFAQIVTPPGVPVPDREKLWNAAEAAEKRQDAVVAREIMIALPPGEGEKAEQVRRTLVLAFAAYIAATHGCAVDVAIHAPPKDGDERNYHAHLLLTTREIAADGSLGKKTRELDDLKKGSKATEKMRAKWAELLNAELEKAGETERVDHRSYARQGLCRVPGVHLGHADAEAERQGIHTERGNLNRAASMINEALEDIRIDPYQPTPSVLDIYTAAVAAAEKEVEARAQGQGRAMEKEMIPPAAPPEPEPAPEPEPEPEPEPAEEIDEWEDLEEEKERQAERDRRRERQEQDRARQQERRKREKERWTLAQTAKSSIPDPPPAAAVEPAPAPGQPPPAKIDPTAPGADYYAKKAARKAAEQAAAAAAARQEEQVSIKDDKQKSSPAIGLTGRQPERHETALERRLREHRADMERKGVYTKTPAPTERERGR